MKAVILAAGEGQRLRPLTLTRPKHLFPIAGKPLLEHLLLALKEADITEVLLIVNYKAEKIKEHIGDGSNLDMKIEYVLQRNVTGTADAFGTVRNLVTDDFIAVYGDLILAKETIKTVLESHRRTLPSATLTTLHVEHPEYYGVVRTESNKVVEIIEKPTINTAKGKAVNAGIYVFSTDIFDAIERTENSPRGEREITDSIRLLIEDGKPVFATEIPSDEWMDVGKPWDLLRANARMLGQIESDRIGLIEENVHLFGSVCIELNARIRSGVYVEGPVYFGEGCDIGPNCYIRPCTSIGRNVRIGNSCEVKNSIIMNDVHMGHLSYVGDSVIGENCNLGAGFISANVRFDEGTIKARVKGEIVDSATKKMGVFMGDNTKTGVGAVCMPGVSIGPNCWIGPNVVVAKDVPSNTRLFLKQLYEETSI